MGAIVLFLLAVLFVAAVWGREAAQKLFKGGMKVAAVLFVLVAILVMLLAINLQPPSQTEMQRTLDAASHSAYHVPLESGNPVDPGAPLRRPEVGQPSATTGLSPTFMAEDNYLTGRSSAANAPSGYAPPLASPVRPAHPSEYGNPKIGIQPEPLRPENGASYGLPAGYGLYVRAVFPNTTAQAAGIQVGDYISQVDGHWITSVDDLNRHNVGKQTGDVIVLRVLRGGQQYLVRVPLGSP